jgi:hypothetical protein
MQNLRQRQATLIGQKQQRGGNSSSAGSGSSGSPRSSAPSGTVVPADGGGTWIVPGHGTSELRPGDPIPAGAYRVGSPPPGTAHAIQKRAGDGTWTPGKKSASDYQRTY